MRKIKAIIFDWGGVLIDNPAPGMLRYCAEKLAVPEKNLIKIYDEFSDDFQTNRIPEKILWQRIRERIRSNNRTLKNNIKIRDVEPLYDLLWFDAFIHEYSPRKNMFRLATTLKNKGYKIGLLSNTEVKIMEYYRQLNYDMIDVAVFSCAEGIAKPDDRIYHIMLNKLGVPAGETVFVDDKRENVTRAALIGMKAIFFKNYKQLKLQLNKIGVNVNSV